MRRASNATGVPWCVLLSTLCLNVAVSGAASDPPTVSRGAETTVTVSLPGRAIAPVEFKVSPAPGVAVREPYVGRTNARAIELRVRVPASAPTGDLLIATTTFTDAGGRQTTIESRVFVAAESSGEAGPHPIEDERGATRSDVRAITAPVGLLPGTGYVGVTELGTTRPASAESGFGVDVQGKATADTAFKASYIRGWNPGVTASYRYGMHAARGELEFRNPRWTLAAGELLTDTNLAGVRTVSDGISFERTAGAVIGSATVARPKYYGGGWAGHLAQGSIGVAFTGGRIMLVGADLSRPTARLSVIVSPPDADVDSELVNEDLERLGTLFSREDRLRAGGVDARLQRGKHLLSGRAGWVDLVGPAGDRSRGAVADASYSYTSRRGAVTTRLRRSPPAVPGTNMSGDSLSTSGRLNVAGPFTATSRGFMNESVVFGRRQPTIARGISAGIEYAKGAANLHIEGNYRESRLVAMRVSRTLTARARWPLGALLVDAAGEYGSARTAGHSEPIAAHRLALLYEIEPVTVTLTGSYQDYGVLPERFSVDLGGGAEWRAAMLEGGVGISRGQLFGDELHAWAALEVKLPRQFTIQAGIDYDRWNVESSPFLTFVPRPGDLAPPWRLTLNLQKSFWIRLPSAR